MAIVYLNLCNQYLKRMFGPPETLWFFTRGTRLGNCWHTDTSRNQDYTRGLVRLHRRNASCGFSVFLAKPVGPVDGGSLWTFIQFKIRYFEWRISHRNNGIVTRAFADSTTRKRKTNRFPRSLRPPERKTLIFLPTNSRVFVRMLFSFSALPFSAPS